MKDVSLFSHETPCIQTEFERETDGNLWVKVFTWSHSLHNKYVPHVSSQATQKWTKHALSRSFLDSIYGLQLIQDSITNVKQQQRWPSVLFKSISNYGIQTTSRLNPSFFRCYMILPSWSVISHTPIEAPG